MKSLINEICNLQSRKIEKEVVSDSPFSHLHVHSQFSILQSTIDVNSLVNKAADMGMPAVGLTDHTNMFGSYKFIDTVLNHPVNANLKKGQDSCS